MRGAACYDGAKTPSGTLFGNWLSPRSPSIGIALDRVFRWLKTGERRGKGSERGKEEPVAGRETFSTVILIGKPLIVVS